MTTNFGTKLIFVHLADHTYSSHWRSEKDCGIAFPISESKWHYLARSANLPEGLYIFC